MTEEDGADAVWDFFVSYTQADRAWAEWIAWVLEEDGRRVLIQAWDFVGGSNWIHSMQEGVTRADRTISVLSEAYLTSVYGKAEWQAAWAADPLGQQRKLLPVRVTDCDRPGFLAGVVSVDVFGIDEVKARARLQRHAKGAVDGRIKPTVAPEFPGAKRAVPDRARFPGSLPPVWRMGAHNPNFVGRDTELARLARELAASSTVTVHALRGLGGVGKTQLSIEYAYANAPRYDVVWQIRSEEPATIPDQFAALATALGLDPEADPERLQVQVFRQLQATTAWLLVFDNAEKLADLRPWIPTWPMPPGAMGHVVVTTRRNGYDQLGAVLDLDVLDLTDAVDLLHKRVPLLSKADARAVAEEMGRLPLALEQAAAYLGKTKMKACDYLVLFRTRTAELLARGDDSSGAGKTVATLWSVSLDRLRVEDPAAVKLLDICAYLAPEPIPLDLFTLHIEELPAPLNASAADPLEFADTLGAITGYSLAKQSGSGLELHRLVQAAIRASHRVGPAPAG